MSSYPFKGSDTQSFHILHIAVVMIYDNLSNNCQINLKSLYEMEEFVPMAKPEHDALRRWGKKEDTDWNYLDSNGMLLTICRLTTCIMSPPAAHRTTRRNQIPKVIEMIPVNVLSQKKISAN